MQTVEFCRKTYIVAPGAGIPDGAIDPIDLASKDQVSLFNLLASNTGTATTKKFSDRKVGARRITNELIKWVSSGDVPLPTATEEIPAVKVEKTVKVEEIKKKTPKADRKKRGMRFVFPYEGDDNLRSIRSSNSLRGRAIRLLILGAYFSDVVKLVAEFDVDRGHGPGHQERRAYEVVRLLHYYVGYGVGQHGDGKIFIHKNLPGTS